MFECSAARLLLAEISLEPHARLRHAGALYIVDVGIAYGVPVKPPKSDPCYLPLSGSHTQSMLPPLLLGIYRLVPFLTVDSVQHLA